ncbi:MAG: potassium channel family protein, partial [Pseudomonadales bacterium]
MLPVNRIHKIILKYFIDLRWHSILLAIAIYFVVSWLLLALSNEHAMTQGTNFLYWIIVTASTVGYGDLSPTTSAGKYVVALFIIPVGLSLFGLVIGHLAGFVSQQWRKGVKGLRSLHLENHILIIGWNGNRTLQLIRLLLKEAEQADEQISIALCVKADIENPLPEQIGFVKVTSFSDDHGMDRAGVAKAKSIIIDNPEDDLTMTSALYCAHRNPEAHAIAYFKDESLGALLKNHCPKIECMPSVAVEMIAKSAVDPGSSLLHHQLLNSNQGMTQYSIRYSASQSVSFEHLFELFKRRYQATLIG